MISREVTAIQQCSRRLEGFQTELQYLYEWETEIAFPQLCAAIKKIMTIQSKRK